MRLSADLRDRTKRFASLNIQFYVALPRSRREVEVLGHQLLRSGTSVAANAREASRARSSQEFISKLNIVIQEADESLLWLELLHEECGIKHANLNELMKEANELIAIFTTMSIRSKA